MSPFCVFCKQSFEIEGLGNLPAKAPSGHDTLYPPGPTYIPRNKLEKKVFQNLILSIFFQIRLSGKIDLGLSYQHKYPEKFSELLSDC